LEDSEAQAANNPKFNPKAAANQVYDKDAAEVAPRPDGPPQGSGISIGFYNFETANKTEFVLQLVDLVVKSGVYCTAATYLIQQLF